MGQSVYGLPVDDLVDEFYGVVIQDSYTKNYYLRESNGYPLITNRLIAEEIAGESTDPARVVRIRISIEEAD
jgi:hypothetical protein